LSSIRKAIDNEVTGQGSSLSGIAHGQLMRGTLREMHLSAPTTGRSTREEAATEISELRNRIMRNATEVPPMPPMPRRQEPQFKPAPEPIVVRNDFKGIMGGGTPRAALPPPRQSPKPSLRRETIQDDFDDISYQPAPARHADPYAAPQQHDEPYYDHQEPAQDYDYGHAQPQPRLMSSHTEAVTETAFRHLYQNLFARHAGDRSIEDMTREMLRGMLQQWLDDNLPPLVERLVREEISRVARNGR
jgi:uncharacterized protein